MKNLLMMAALVLLLPIAGCTLSPAVATPGPAGPAGQTGQVFVGATASCPVATDFQRLF